MCWAERRQFFTEKRMISLRRQQFNLIVKRLPLKPFTPSSTCTQVWVWVEIQMNAVAGL